MKRFFDAIPRVLAHWSHILFLLGLFVYLVPLALIDAHLVSDRAMLILGNYTNVTSAAGSSIAAGAGLAMTRQGHQRNKLTAEMHRLLHAVHHEKAKELGHVESETP